MLALLCFRLPNKSYLFIYLLNFLSDSEDVPERGIVSVLHWEPGGREGPAGSRCDSYKHRYAAPPTPSTLNMRYRRTATFFSPVSTNVHVHTVVLFYLSETTLTVIIHPLYK